MANRYDKGDKIRLKTTGGVFSDADGAAFDPTVVICKVRDPSGNVSTYGYGLSSQGAWDASANSPTLADGTGTAGHYYTVSAAGSVDFGNGEISFTTSDFVFYSGGKWLKAEGGSTTALTKNDTGDYHVDVTADEGGEWYYRYQGYSSAGDERGADENEFLVSEGVF